MNFQYSVLAIAGFIIVLYFIFLMYYIDDTPDKVTYPPFDHPCPDFFDLSYVDFQDSDTTTNYTGVQRCINTHKIGIAFDDTLDINLDGTDVPINHVTINQDHLYINYSDVDGDKEYSTWDENDVTDTTDDATITATETVTESSTYVTSDKCDLKDWAIGSYLTWTGITDQDLDCTNKSID